MGPALSRGCLGCPAVHGYVLVNTGLIVNASRIPPRPLGSSELSENWKARDLHVVRTRDYWLTVFLWRSLGASWGLLGASWGPLGALSGASWGPLGASWVPAPPPGPPQFG